MTKPIRGNPQLPPPAIPPIQSAKQNYMRINHAAYLMVTGISVTKAAKILNCHQQTAADLYADKQVMAVADELSAQMKEQFASKSAAFIQRILDNLEKEYTKLQPEMANNVDVWIKIRDAMDLNGIEHIYNVGARLSASKELSGRHDTITKTVMSYKEAATTASFTIPLTALTIALAKDTGKTIDVTPPVNGEAQ